MSSSNSTRSRLIAGVAGNVLEWYDFALYGYLVPIISKLFFPGDNPTASQLASFGIFAVGFLMRPLGATLFGHIGDRYGRRIALYLSIIMMAVPTFLIGCLPTYESIGIMAALLLTFLRLIQGLSVGGEFTTSVTYVVETSPANRRGLSGSWANIGSIGGSLLGVGTAAAVTTFLSESTVEAWGWRVPFLIGGVLGVIGLWLRKNLPESSMFDDSDTEDNSETPLTRVFTQDRKRLFQAIMFTAGYGVLFFIPMIYLPTHLHKFVNIEMGQALLINALGTALLIPLMPAAGYLSDRFIRRRNLLIVITITMAVSSYPLFILLNTGNVQNIIMAQMAFAIIAAFALGTTPAMVSEMFPTKNRVTAYSLAYNIGLGIFGGTAPIVSVWLVEKLGNNAPAGNLILTSLLATIALWIIHDRSREPLE